MSSLMRYIHPRVQTHNLPRLIHTSTASFGAKSRILNRLPASVRSEPEMRDTPDYSFLDGRPTPLGRARALRTKKQEELGEKVVTLLEQVDYALKRGDIYKEERRLKEEAILSRKLKPKGVMYKPKNSSTDAA